MDIVKGEQGELIDGLIELVDSDELGHMAWYDLGTWAGLLIGGPPISVSIDNGTDPEPGTIGYAHRQQSGLVSRAQYFELVSDRLVEIVASGVDEAFLVKSVRDALRQFLEMMADTGEADRNRAGLREFMLHRADELEAEDPEEAARIRRTAERGLLQETSPEEAASKWSGLSKWQEREAEILPDSVFSDWRSRRPRR